MKQRRVSVKDKILENQREDVVAHRSHESLVPLHPIPIQALYNIAHLRLVLRLLHHRPTHHRLTRRA